MTDYEQVENLKAHCERYNALLKQAKTDLSVVYSDIKRLAKAAQGSGLTVEIGWQEHDEVASWQYHGQNPMFDMCLEISRTTKL